MKKRRSRDRTAEAYKKHRKPGTNSLRAKVTKKPGTLEEKTIAISSLALKSDPLSFGPSGFTDLFKMRK